MHKSTPTSAVYVTTVLVTGTFTRDALLTSFGFVRVRDLSAFARAWSISRMLAEPVKLKRRATGSVTGLLRTTIGLAATARASVRMARSFMAIACLEAGLGLCWRGVLLELRIGRPTDAVFIPPTRTLARVNHHVHLRVCLYRVPSGKLWPGVNVLNLCHDAHAGGREARAC